MNYFDANLMCNVLDGKAVTGCLHFINKMVPITWYIFYYEAKYLRDGDIWCGVQCSMKS